MYGEDSQELLNQNRPQPPRYSPTEEDPARTAKSAAAQQDLNAEKNFQEPRCNISDEEYEKSEKKRSEKFLVLTLIAGAGITAVLIAAGMAFFYPKADDSGMQTALPQPLSTNDSTEKDAVADSNDDVIIVYGGNNFDTAQDAAKGTAPGKNAPAAQDTKQQSESSLTRAADQVSPPSALIEEPPADLHRSQSIPTTSKASAAPNVPKAAVISSGSTNSEGVVRPRLSPITRQPIKPIKKETYWVQVFSTNDRTKALSIKDEFAQRGVASTILAKNINDNLYYRLRIGPYYSKAESDKFLRWVKQIKQYKDAYISVIYI